VTVVDEKYQDPPRCVDKLEVDVAEFQRRSAPAAPKRSGKQK
jgi:hypothetical protein